jgi:hypothetical protein
MNHHPPTHSHRRVTRAAFLASSACSLLTLCSVMPTVAHAGYPAVYWRTVNTAIPAKSCLSTLSRSIKQSGFDRTEADAQEVRGTTANERAFAMCVNLPKAGACNGSGSTAVFVVSSSESGERAQKLLDGMVKAFGKPQLIDCG